MAKHFTDWIVGGIQDKYSGFFAEGRFQLLKIEDPLVFLSELLLQVEPCLKLGGRLLISGFEGYSDGNSSLHGNLWAVEVVGRVDDDSLIAGVDESADGTVETLAASVDNQNICLGVQIGEGLPVVCYNCIG